MYNEDWTYEQYLNAVDRAKERKQDGVLLDTEHCTYISSERIARWAIEDGYTVKEKMDSMIITF